MQTVIKKILSERKRFLSLLLLADEQESMIDKYIGRGDMFVMYNQDGVAICSAIVTDEGNGICEIKSLAVAPEYQRKGYGKEMTDFLSRHYADKLPYDCRNRRQYAYNIILSEMRISLFPYCVGFLYLQL